MMPIPARFDLIDSPQAQEVSHLSDVGLIGTTLTKGNTVNKTIYFRMFSFYSNFHGNLEAKPQERKKAVPLVGEKPDSCT